jgi:hypothetical protein
VEAWAFILLLPAPASSCCLRRHALAACALILVLPVLPVPPLACFFISLLLAAACLASCSMSILRLPLSSANACAGLTLAYTIAY